MSDTLYYILCGLCVGMVLLGINLMSKVKLSVKGNALSALAMILAVGTTVALTVAGYGTAFLVPLAVALLIGCAVGIVGAAKAMREGIDRVDPSIPGVFCGCGHNFEFGAEITEALAGEGNPTVVRINNGNYLANHGRGFSNVFLKFRQCLVYKVLR